MTSAPALRRSNSPHDADRRQLEGRRRRTKPRLAFDSLDERLLLAAGVPSGTIALIEASIPAGAKSTRVAFTIDSSLFTSTKPNDKPILGFYATATDGSTTSVSGPFLRNGKPIAIQKLGSNQILAALGTGQFSVKVTGRPGADVMLGVRLLGNTDADGDVDGRDLNSVAGGLGGVHSAARSGFDVNLDGRVNRRDVMLTRRNVGISTTVQALRVSSDIATAHDPDRDDVVDTSTVDLVGTALPFAQVNLTPAGNGFLARQVTASGAPIMTTIADASGAYHFNSVPVAMGTSNFLVTSTGLMSQRTSALTSVTRVTDTGTSMTSAQRMAKFQNTDIRGISYTPEPSNDVPQPPPVYFDSDFWNDQFKPMWSSQQNIPGYTVNGTPVDGRGDLATLQSLGINFLHIYDWGSQRDHTEFMQTALASGIRMDAPISNYYFTLQMNGVNKAAGQYVTRMKFVHDIFNQVYTGLGNGDTTPNPAISMWLVTNEPDYNGYDPNQVAQIVQMIVYLENLNNIPDGNRLPIAIPFGWGIHWNGGFGTHNSATPSVSAVEDMYDAFKNSAAFQATDGDAFNPLPPAVSIPALPTDFFTSRFVWGNNPVGNDNSFFLGLKTFATYAPYYAPTDGIADIDWTTIPMFFGENGKSALDPGSSPAIQAQVDQQQLADVAAARASANSKNFYGACVFQSLDQVVHKTAAESGFGIQTPRKNGSNYVFQIVTNGPNIPVPPGAQGANVWYLDYLDNKPVFQVVKNAWGKK
jgi:hypothetical protein